MNLSDQQARANFFTASACLSKHLMSRTAALSVEGEGDGGRKAKRDQEREESKKAKLGDRGGQKEDV